MQAKSPADSSGAPTAPPSRELEALRDQQALRLQRKQRLHALIFKRKMNLEYLQKAHQGETFWLNCTLLRAQDIHRYAQTVVPKQRSLSYFYLALSLGKLLAAHPDVVGVSLVRLLAQLIEEWEYHFAGAAVQGVKFVTAKTSPGIYPQLVGTPLQLPPPPLPLPLNSAVAVAAADAEQPSASAAASAAAAVKISPSVLRFSSSVVYEALLTPHMPFEALDFVQVFTSLCAALLDTYDALSKHADSHSVSAAYEAILKIDGRIKHHVIDVATKELTEVSQLGSASMMEALRTEAPPSWR